MRIAISMVEYPVARRVIDELRNAGARCREHTLDGKIKLLAPIVWGSAKEPGTWIFSALVNEKTKTVLLRADAPIPPNKMREVKAILQHMNGESLDGDFELTDGADSIVYVVGPDPYDTDHESLWDKILSMETVTQEASSSLEKLMTVSTSQAGAQKRSAKANRQIVRVARA